MKTLLLGLGNPILSDDGIGVRVVEAAAADLPSSAAVDVRLMSVGGLRLMEEMVGYDRAIVVDAWRCAPETAGSWRRLGLAELESVCLTQHSASAHDTNLLTALKFGRKLHLPLPDPITIFAVDVMNVTDFGENLSPPVAAAIPSLVAAVRRELMPDMHVRPIEQDCVDG